jgi:hypothetical protein
MFAPRFNSGSGTTPTGSYALSLDGSTESGAAGNMNLSGSALSFEGWIKPSSFKSASPYISSIMGTEVSDAIQHSYDWEMPVWRIISFSLY